MKINQELNTPNFVHPKCKQGLSHCDQQNFVLFRSLCILGCIIANMGCQW